jgi:hypothetical protein
MNQFKFFRGYSHGRFDLLFGETHATASIHHSNLEINNEMERWFGERNLTLVPREEVRLFQATTTISANPTLWTKVKIFGTKIKLVLIETWKKERIGAIWVGLLGIVITLISIAKLLGA